jgi:hypothetical protein
MLSKSLKILGACIVLGIGIDGCAHSAQQEAKSHTQAGDASGTTAFQTQTQTTTKASEAGAQPPTFHGYRCTLSCEGHERGYEWAEEKGIDDPETCYSGERLSEPTNSSFGEGCEAYVVESTGAARIDPYGDYVGE